NLPGVDEDRHRSERIRREVKRVRGRARGQDRHSDDVAGHLPAQRLEEDEEIPVERDSRSAEPAGRELERRRPREEGGAAGELPGRVREKEQEEQAGARGEGRELPPAHTGSGYAAQSSATVARTS